MTAIADPRFRILVYSHAAGYVHDSTPAAVAAIRGLGAAHGFAVQSSADPSKFTDERLSAFDALVFVHTSGDVLPDPGQRRSLERYIRAGGGFFAIHGASSLGPLAEEWPFYRGLVGAAFTRHPVGCIPAVVLVEDPSSPAMRGFDARSEWVDEWYGFDRNPRPDVHVLATVGESSYRPAGDAEGKMGPDHPIVWCHRYQGGRSLYNALGHDASAWSDARFLDSILGGIELVAGAVPFDVPDR